MEPLARRLLIDELSDRLIIKDKKVKNIEIVITKKSFAGIINKVFFINQTHSDKVILIDNEKQLLKLFEGDAIISSINCKIGIKTADCLPIFIYSNKGNVFAAVHSGWRGTAQRIIEKTIKFMENNLQIHKKELNFILGVCICKNCYEIKKDMFNKFIKIFGEKGRKFFSKNIDRFDLKGANIHILLENGIEAEQIFNLHKCSYCNNEFFSYRKGDLKSRTFNIIGTKERGKTCLL